MSDCDVLVVGAGPAGCATAIRTARAGLSTILIDRARPARTWAGESLPPGMGKLMGSVFGDGILSERHHRAAFGTRSVWGSAELAETDFLTNPLGHGWLLDRARFDADAKVAAATAGVTIATVRRLGLVSRASGWQVETGDDASFTAGFLVDATGRSAALLRQLRVARIDADRQIAILATFADDGDAYCGTTVEAVADGWWYATPLPGGRRVLAYLTDDDLWRQGERDWHGLLGETLHIGRCAGSNALSATPRAYPAATAQTDQLFGEGWLAVGDAAASFDPLSSQGLASAVLMGARAGEALVQPDRKQAIAAWAAAYAMMVAEHADLRTHYARLEDRWPVSVFWRRRQQPDESLTRPRWVGQRKQRV
ncbi:MAG: NAD(P)/FAD-dependent oxidoreductase [Hyphomicrobiales bacterium]|nr:NAD(P)/FAD-dependent oxidoreductase [Hyphomicrobiales bacterium]